MAPWEQHLRKTASWLVEMADNPLTGGKKGHAAFRLEELMRDPLYARLPELIADVRAATASPSAPDVVRTTESTGQRRPAA